ncbi:MAG: hypothetical protein ACXAE3_10000 [Candidatus Kariarchaeaceae archaeon]|jgi:ElaB/YqjD/DUF883 family membrane-anchored ribosome-binding protein
MSKENKKINDVLKEARSKIRDQLDSTAKLSKALVDQTQEKTKELGGKIEQTAKDTKETLKDNGESILSILGVMLIL